MLRKNPNKLSGGITSLAYEVVQIFGRVSGCQKAKRNLNGPPRVKMSQVEPDKTCVCLNW